MCRTELSWPVSEQTPDAGALARSIFFSTRAPPSLALSPSTPHLRNPAAGGRRPTPRGPGRPAGRSARTAARAPVGRAGVGGLAVREKRGAWCAPASPLTFFFRGHRLDRRRERCRPAPGTNDDKKTTCARTRGVGRREGCGAAAQAAPSPPPSLPSPGSTHPPPHSPLPPAPSATSATCPSAPTPRFPWLSASGRPR